VATNIVWLAAAGLSPLKKKPTAFFGDGFLKINKDILRMSSSLSKEYTSVLF
jgi:hypothetical protein